MTEVTALYKSCQLSSRVVQQELRIATTALRELVEAALGWQWASPCSRVEALSHGCCVRHRLAAIIGTMGQRCPSCIEHGCFVAMLERLLARDPHPELFPDQEIQQVLEGAHLWLPVELLPQQHVGINDVSEGEGALALRLAAHNVDFLQSFED